MSDTDSDSDTIVNINHHLFLLPVQFSRASGTGNEETDMWIAYCAFHLGDYKRSMEVSV